MDTNLIERGASVSVTKSALLLTSLTQDVGAFVIGTAHQATSLILESVSVSVPRHAYQVRSMPVGLPVTSYMKNYTVA